MRIQKIRIFGRATHKNHQPFFCRCKNCGITYGYYVPPAYNYAALGKFFEKGSNCPECQTPNFPKVLIFDVNDEYNFKPIK